MNGPLSGISVVEFPLDISDLGLGLAGGLPGLILSHLGASVTRVAERPSGIDEGLIWTDSWQRRTTVRAWAQTADLVRTADVVIVYGDATTAETKGLSSSACRESRPELIHCLVGASRVGDGPPLSYAMLVEAAAGLYSQLPTPNGEPRFLDMKCAASGTAFLLTAAVLGLIYERMRTGLGGYFETTLYDGLLASVGGMVGRSDRAPAHVERHWEIGPAYPDMLYRCADEEWIQVWLGGKGMFERFLRIVGERADNRGFYASAAEGDLSTRSARWEPIFRRETCLTWLERLRAAGIACERVRSSAEGLELRQVQDVGLCETATGAEGATLRCAAVPVAVTPADPAAGALPAHRLLHGVRVLDFSAYVAGPFACQVLADLGADVVKVEPISGEAMRGAPYAFSVCQRGKRAVAIDLRAPDGQDAVHALMAGTDVLLHNFRRGVDQRLGIDEASVRGVAPGVVYCHVSGYGQTGEMVSLPANDALIQALTGIEHALAGGAGRPIRPTWFPVDVAAGWLTACGMLAALIARRRSGLGQRVDTSLLGAGLLLQSGGVYRNGRFVPGPTVDETQTGYGPCYRIYRTSDGWLAVVVPDGDAWERLRALPEFVALPPSYTPLRVEPQTESAIVAERALELVLLANNAEYWESRLSEISIPCVAFGFATRDGFRRGILDSGPNHELARVISFDTPEWGRLEQIGPLFRIGPEPVPEGRRRAPAVGEDTVEVLAEAGIPHDRIADLLSSGVIVQGSTSETHNEVMTT
jgi:crotonobetainyl-CoA:carnitine CoA-transferase CaiB-like acyl-CoA transferase